MLTNLSSALIIAVVGLISGYVIAYYIFRKIIGNKYSNKIYEWCGFIGMLAIGQGLSTIIIQILSFLISDLVIDVDKIIRGAVILIVLPLLLLVLSILLNEIYKKFSSSSAKNKTISSKPRTQISLKFMSFKNKIVLISSTVILISIAGHFLFYDKFFSRERRFAISECNVCNWSYGEKAPNCKKSNLKHITVFDSKVIYYYESDEGESSVRAIPNLEDKCLFNVGRKFSFSCTSVVNEARQIFTTSEKFDGKESLIRYFATHMLSQGEMVKALESKTSCKVKG